MLLWYTWQVVTGHFSQNAWVAVQSIIILHNNAKPYTGNWTSDYVQCHCSKVMHHPPYNTDLTPTDFRLLRSTWLASDLQQMPGWHKLSPLAYRHLTPIFMLENFSFRADRRPKCIDTSCQYAWLKTVNKMCTAAIPYDLVQCLMCNVCQIIPKSVELVMMALEVTWKCHFQMLTVTANYPLNQEFQNCREFFTPMYNFLLEKIHEDGKKKHLGVHFHHSDRYCTFCSATGFMILRAYSCCCVFHNTLCWHKHKFEVTVW